jgi:hypothetical protein
MSLIMILRQKNHTDALVLKVKAEGQEKRSNCCGF